MYRPVAYTYEADIHCPACTTKRFPPCDPHKQLACCGAVDAEGNEVGAIFSWEEDAIDAYCGDCFEAIG